MNEIVNGFIRKSTDDDLKDTLLWLNEQDSNGEQSFFCHKDLIIAMHKQGNMIVFIENQSNGAVGFQIGGLIEPGLLEVKKDNHRNGIGKQIVQYCIEELRKNDICILQIECTPYSSVKFWKKMGFITYGDMDKYAYQLLKKKLEVPKEGIDCSVEITFYPESKKWDEKIQALKTFKPIAKKIIRNSVFLSERIIFFDPYFRNNRDIVISINIDHKIIYKDKSKYQQAKELGVISYNGAYYIDTIQIDEMH